MVRDRRTLSRAARELGQVFFSPKRPPAEDTGQGLSWSVHFRFLDGIPLSLGLAGLAQLSNSSALACPQLVGQLST